MDEELDLTKSKWVISNDLHLDIIVASIHDNYPTIELEEELENSGYVLEDFMDINKLNSFLGILNEKYPD